MAKIETPILQLKQKANNIEEEEVTFFHVTLSFLSEQFFVARL